MALLKPGTGNQRRNREKAIKFLESEIFEISQTDIDDGTITIEEGTTYKVSAYAETPAAFVSTPGRDISENSIYETGLPALMVRQLKDGRIFVYEVNPYDISTDTNTAEWKVVDKASTRVWIHKNGQTNLSDRR